MAFSVPDEAFVKPRWMGLVNNFVADVERNPRAHTFIAKGSNMESLVEVWAETGDQHIKLLASFLKSKAASPIKVEKHPSTGDQKVVFDQEQNFYVTVVQQGDKLLLSGIGSVLGNYITSKAKVPSEDFVKANWAKLVKELHKEVSEDPVSVPSYVEKNSNMDQLLEVWSGSSTEEESATPPSKTPLNILTDLLLAHVSSPIKCELHATTGDQKVIFNQSKGFYVTVVRIGDDLLLSGLGSALGNHITQEWEKMIS